MACAGKPSKIQGLAERVELSGVPFFRSEAYQGGPVALASMLYQQGIVITPGLLDEPLHLPGAEADLERNIQVLARKYGMLVYPLDAELPQLLRQVTAGYPVMVRLTEGSAFWAQPRYAVLVGYDQRKRTVLLRSGMDRRLMMDFSAFESAWQSAGHWAVLILRPGQLPVGVDAQRWRQAADALAQAGQEHASRQALKTLAAGPIKP